MNLRRIAGICFSPTREWDAIAAEPASVVGLFLRYILPFSLIAPITSVIGMKLFGSAWHPDYGYFVRADQIVGNGIRTFVVSLLTIFMLAGMYWLLARMYKVKRNFLAALKVAVFGAIPVWISALFLFLAPMILLSMAAVAYSCHLYSVGLSRVMGVREDQGMEFAAVSLLIVMEMTVFIGGLSGEMGLT